MPVNVKKTVLGGSLLPSTRWYVCSSCGSFFESPYGVYSISCVPIAENEMEKKLDNEIEPVVSDFGSRPWVPFRGYIGWHRNINPNNGESNGQQIGTGAR